MEAIQAKMFGKAKANRIDAGNTCSIGNKHLVRTLLHVWYCT